MASIGIIGGGVSGLSVAHLLKDRFLVKVFEKDSKPGGLIKCEIINGNLYHKVGGHVFNSHRQEVLNWFWNFFNKEFEFNKIIRNSIAYIERPIAYPVENHIYEFDKVKTRQIINELLSIACQGYFEATNFEYFLKTHFGETLYNIYFKPYNEKIWSGDLSEVPVSWLADKLPMPSIEEIIFNNLQREKETEMVHSSFYYPKQNGSQFIADRLADGLDIEYNSEVRKLVRLNNTWIVNDIYSFDMVVFTGNIKELPGIMTEQDLAGYNNDIENLGYHGTTSVLCKVNLNPYTWIYLPDPDYSAHRIICTGNFSENNNSKEILTATVEFTNAISKDDIMPDLKKIPFSLEYITHNYTKYTYPIQSKDTREMVSCLKQKMRSKNLYLVGRFAEWEYYNMDDAIAAAMAFSKSNFES